MENIHYPVKGQKRRFCGAKTRKGSPCRKPTHGKRTLPPAWRNELIRPASWAVQTWAIHQGGNRSKKMAVGSCGGMPGFNAAERLSLCSLILKYSASCATATGGTWQGPHGLLSTCFAHPLSCYFMTGTVCRSYYTLAMQPRLDDYKKMPFD